MTMARRRLLDDTFKKSVVGNPAIATDSLARMYPGIEMQGWTEQDSTTGAQLLDLSNTADRTDTTYVLTDTGLTVTGLFYVSTLVDVNPNTDMYISYEKSGDGVNIVSIYNSSGLESDDRIATYATQGGTFNTGDNSQINVLFYSGQGTSSSSSSTYSNVMLNEGTGAKPYEPYTGGAPSPSPDYPQEIVSAGNWDETAQKWEYEIEISNAEQNPTEIQTVTLQSDRPLTKWDRLEKRGGQWGWVYKSEEIESYTDGGVPGEYFSTTGQLSVGAQVWYETTEETFIPLTTAEQEAMNALHTYRPTTVLSNQQDCDMTLTYKTRKGMS